MKIKIPKWITKLIPKNLLPASGTISIGMVQYEKYSVPKGTVSTSNLNTTANADFATLSSDFSNNANLDSDGGGIGSGTTSRVNLLAAPYGLNEFYGYRYGSCLLIGTKASRVSIFFSFNFFVSSSLVTENLSSKYILKTHIIYFETHSLTTGIFIPLTF